MARNQQLRRSAAAVGERLTDERADRAVSTIARALKDPRGDPRSSSETPAGERN